MILMNGLLYSFRGLALLVKKYYELFGRRLEKAALGELA